MKTDEWFSQSLLHKLQQEATTKIFGKGEYLVREGEIEKYIYFIETGAVRAFITSDAEEQTIRFGYAGSFITSISSFITQRPSEMAIEALRKTTAKVISRNSLLAMVHADMQSQQQYITMLETLITQQMERETDLLTTNPAARLQRVLDRSPNLFQEIPLKYIASYLRMTPETLSRIRNS